MILLILLLGQDALPEGSVARLGSLSGLHQSAICCLDLAPDGKRLVSGGWDGRAKVWDAATLKLLWATDQGGGRILSARFSPDGLLLATVDGQGPVRIWDSGKLVRNLDGLQNGTAQVAFSADGRLVVAGSLRGELFVWDLADGGVVLKRETKLSKPA